jgi:hypothetical protein
MMKTYVVRRRADWPTADELEEAAARSLGETEWRFEEVRWETPGESAWRFEQVRWLRSYIVEEPDGSLGTVCIYEASDPEALRHETRRAGLPVTEVLEVTDTIVVRPDRQAVAA